MLNNAVFPLPFDTKLNFNSNEDGRTAERGFSWTLSEIFRELITQQIFLSLQLIKSYPLPWSAVAS